MGNLGRSLSRAIGPIVFLAAMGIASAADVQRGRILYHKHGCYACHGHNGMGTFAERQSSLLPKPRPLLVGTAPILGSEEVLRIYLRLRGGEHPPEPQVQMPHYPEAQLNDAAVADLYAFIKTFRDDPPPIDRIAPMRAILDAAAKR